MIIESKKKEIRLEQKSEISKLKEITLTGFFLALSSIFILFQIPFYSFLNIDISSLFLLISISYLSLRYVMIIAIFSPIFLFVIGADIVSVLTIITFNLLLVFFHKLFYSRKNLFKLFSSLFLIILFVSIIMTFLNILIFTPAWYGFDYQLVFSEIERFFIVILPFNIIKLTIIYFLFLIIAKRVNFHIMNL